MALPWCYATYPSPRSRAGPRTRIAGLFKLLWISCWRYAIATFFKRFCRGLGSTHRPTLTELEEGGFRPFVLSAAIAAIGNAPKSITLPTYLRAIIAPTTYLARFSTRIWDVDGAPFYSPRPRLPSRSTNPTGIVHTEMACGPIPLNQWTWSWHKKPPEESSPSPKVILFRR